MSIVKPQVCILTTTEQLDEFPLIVSHTDFKRIQIGGEESLVGYQFFNSKNADSYETLLKQLGVAYKKVSITLPVEDSQYEVPFRGKKRELTVEMVKRLRSESGFSMMECKKALIDADHDYAKALDLLKYVGRARHSYYLTTCRH